jgi:alanine racemase
MFESTIADFDAHRPTHLQVDCGRICANYQQLKAHANGAKVMAILKANAYGHGLLEVAQALESQGADYFGVAYVEEGVLLRKTGVETAILVLGGIIGDQIPIFIKNRLEITASSIDKLMAIDRCAATMGVRARVHLKIDTGMERIGVHDYSAASLLEASTTCQNTEIVGIFSHFATADDVNPSFAETQMARFEKVLDWYRENNVAMPMRHMANSAAMLRFPQSHYDMVRPGIALYGAAPVANELNLQMAIRWVSKIVYFKVVEADRTVSYGATWRAPEQTRIVTIPVGYGDGYMRANSNRSHVLIRGKRYPVVGKVCMDQLMVNIGWDEAYNGEEVVLLGEQGDDRIEIEELADWSQTITYEVLTAMNTRVSRIHASAVDDVPDHD